MNENQEKAVALHAGGCNCGQAVLGVFCEKYGLDLPTGLRAAGGLGGGMRSGEVCGAASGAVLTIGLKDGASKPEDQEQKKFCGEKTAEFMRSFGDRFGSVRCRELLKNHGGSAVCNTLIAEAVAMLEERGY